MPAASSLVVTALFLLGALSSCASASTSPTPPEAGPPTSRTAAELPRIGGKANMNLTLSKVRSPIPDTEAPAFLQLVDTTAGPVVLSSVAVPNEPLKTYVIIVSSVPLRGGTPAAVLTHRPMLPSRERWDAAVRPGGEIVILFEDFLGGSTAIFVDGAREDRPDGTVHKMVSGTSYVDGPRQRWISPRARQDEMFRGPHFVRGIAGRLVASAVDWNTPVLFADLDFREDSLEGLPTRPIGVACSDAVVVADGEGFAVVYTVVANRPAVEGEGRLRFARLDAGLKPTTPPLEIFPHTRILDFDATPLADGTAVVATTDTGLSVAVVGRGPAGLAVLGRHDEGVEGKVVSPSILATGGKLYVAASVTPKDPRVLVYEVALGAGDAGPTVTPHL